jgi:Reverse transcriptase (RNA-dependent DNA polymerase)
MGDDNARLYQEMRRLDGFTNPQATAYVNLYSLRSNRDQMHMAFFIVDHDKIDTAKYKNVFSITKNWQEPWNHPDPWLHKRWREAITKELLKMKMNNVWTKIKRSQTKPGRVCIKYKWVFDIKRDGTFCARLVACGYSQVTGVDFQESYSPVINDVVFRILRILIVCQIIWGLTAVLIDVELAFLNGNLDKIIYMECPDGIVCEANEVVRLNKSMYGLVQVAQKFFLKFKSILNKCLFYPM